MSNTQKDEVEKLGSSILLTFDSANLIKKPLSHAELNELVLKEKIKSKILHIIAIPLLTITSLTYIALIYFHYQFNIDFIFGIGLLFLPYISIWMLLLIRAAWLHTLPHQDVENLLQVTKEIPEFNNYLQQVTLTRAIVHLDLEVLAHYWTHYADHSTIAPDLKYKLETILKIE